MLNSTELRAVEGQPIDLNKTDGPAFFLQEQARVQPALVPPPPPARKGKQQKPREPSARQAAARAAGGLPAGVGVLERPAAALTAIPLIDAVFVVSAVIDAVSRGQCW